MRIKGMRGAKAGQSRRLGHTIAGDVIVGPNPIHANHCCGLIGLRSEAGLLEAKAAEGRRQSPEHDWMPGLFAVGIHRALQTAQSTFRPGEDLYAFFG